MAGHGTARDTLRVAFVGEVDHGKSTLLGRVLYDTGAITPDRLDVAVDEGGLAFLLDGLSEERQRLITLDTAQSVVETAERHFLFIDVPGHAELLKNMASGASRADIGVVVLDCTEGAAEQTRRHLRVLELLGVTTCVGAVTKMDLAGYREETFLAVARELATVAGECGIELAAVVPVSALAGVNVTGPAATELPWYDGQPLLSVLHTVGVRRESSALLRFAVQAVVGRAPRRRVTGRVESGTLRVGAELVDAAGRHCVVEAIERFGEPPLSQATAGDSVGLTVRGEEPEPGTVLAPPEQRPQVGRRWRTRILVTAPDGVRAGAPCVVRYSSATVTGTVQRIEQRWNSATGLPVAGRPTDDLGTVEFSEIAAVELLLSVPAPADNVRVCPPLGRFMLCDAAGHALALGIVDEVQAESAAVAVAAGKVTR
ncbi:GTP-binding protein [Micromonospora sp. NPDC047134]|uniref:GTP-binding protein n=1 Tax=Micromonospora sp. NPDC047134 TaxID=3154340 RepID=UPI0033FA9560